VWRLHLMLALSAVVLVPIVETTWTEHRAIFWVDLALGAASYVLVLWRRRWPLTVAVVLTLMTTVSAVAAGPATLAIASLATRRRIWQVIAIGVLSLVCAQAFAVLPAVRGADPYWLTLTVNIAFIVAVLLSGMYAGSRRELIWTLHQRALRAEEEQELRAAKARADERARIAREMHDVLAHRISQVSMHAGALTFRDDLDSDTLRRGIGDIKAKCNEALDELRAVLGVLRDADSGELLDRPQPTYAELPGLVAEARASGMTIELHDVVAEPHALPGAAGRAIYRIVQEGITNARKHAPGAALDVSVTGGPDTGVDVLLRNRVGFHRTTTPGAGLGLVGLRERAELRGGLLEQQVDDGVFELHAWIPWTA
jgi:signal transduction histidine kinase